MYDEVLDACFEKEGAVLLISQNNIFWPEFEIKKLHFLEKKGRMQPPHPNTHEHILHLYFALIQYHIINGCNAYTRHRVRCQFRKAYTDNRPKLPTPTLSLVMCVRIIDPLNCRIVYVQGFRRCPMLIVQRPFSAQS